MRRENDDFRDRYARAREGQADHYFHEMIEIADEPLKENVEAARARNRIDVRKFAVARLAPKKYGDRVSHDVQGVSNNFRPKILIQCSSGGEDEGYIEPHASPETARSVPQQGNGNPAIRGRLFRHVERQHLRALLCFARAALPRSPQRGWPRSSTFDFKLGTVRQSRLCARSALTDLEHRACQLFAAAPMLTTPRACFSLQKQGPS